MIVADSQKNTGISKKKTVGTTPRLLLNRNFNASHRTRNLDAVEVGADSGRGRVWSRQPVLLGSHEAWRGKRGSKGYSSHKKAGWSP